MQSKSSKKRLLVDEEPIPLNKRRGAPDRREVSLRWLSGTILTGVTSITLMGAALVTALDGKQLLATPPEVAERDNSPSRSSLSETTKATRLGMTLAPVSSQPTDRRRMSVSTMTRDGDAEVIRTKPFEHLKIALATARDVNAKYPGFDPLSIFKENSEESIADDGGAGTVIYGANVETEAAIRLEEFAFTTDMADGQFQIGAQEAEQIVRDLATYLVDDGSIQVASLHYVDPLRFGFDDPALSAIANQSRNARVVPENISIAPVDHSPEIADYKEDLIEVRADLSIKDALDASGHEQSESMAMALKTLLNSDRLKAGQVIRLGLESGKEPETWAIIRASLYDKREHVLTIALNDQQQYVPAPEPTDPGVMLSLGGDEEKPKPLVAARGDMPSIYDAIYQGIAAYDLPQGVADRIVKMVAADVDFHAAITPTDAIELFYSLPEEGEDPDSARDILFVKARFGNHEQRFYKYRSEDGTADYYDENGQSARQFLLRNPVPTGQFRSPFGMRRHPILGYSKMHWGVDWAAPHGTPIIAPGNGVVEKAGWVGGYGKQTTIRHANGYKTTYSHQTRFAKGVTPGARVRQGQVIGYIGTTGLSTGPHLHYEMYVNDKRVDPLRVRLPQGNTLKDSELSAFKQERDRIDALIDGEEPTTVAANGS